MSTTTAVWWSGPISASASSGHFWIRRSADGIRSGVRNIAARVGDDRRPAEQLRGPAERLGGVDRAVDDEARRRPVPLGEHLQVAVEREQLVAAAANELVELRGRLLRHTAADVLAGLEHELLPADAVALDDGEEDAALAGGAELGEAVEQAHSTGSTKTSISPPQGRPTFQAMSSVMP